MFLSIITLNVNGLHAPTKRYRIAEWIRKEGPCVHCPPRDPPQIEKYTKTKSKGIVKDISCTWKGK